MSNQQPDKYLGPGLQFQVSAVLDFCKKQQPVLSDLMEFMISV